jgi:hypothetical protein
MPLVIYKTYTGSGDENIEPDAACCHATICNDCHGAHNVVGTVLDIDGTRTAITVLPRESFSGRFEDFRRLEIRTSSTAWRVVLSRWLA